MTSGIQGVSNLPYQNTDYVAAGSVEINDHINKNLWVINENLIKSNGYATSVASTPVTPALSR